MENKNTQLETLVKSSGLSIEKTKEISEGLSAFFEKASEWASKVDAIIVNDISQTGEMKIARESRLMLRGYRLDAEKIIKQKRDVLKEKMSDDILFDKLLLGASKMIKATFENLETKLEEKEKFAERWESENKARIRSERLVRLAMYCDDASIYPVEAMTEENFNSLVVDMQVKQVQRQKEERNKLRQNELIQAGFSWDVIENKFKFESVEVTPEEVEMFSDADFSRRVIESKEIIKNIRAIKQKEIDDLKNKVISLETKVLIDNKDAEVKPVLYESFSDIAKMTQKQRLIYWVDSFKIMASPIANEVSMDIFSKFEGFTKWAKKQIEDRINE